MDKEDQSFSYLLVKRTNPVVVLWKFYSEKCIFFLFFGRKNRLTDNLDVERELHGRMAWDFTDVSARVAEADGPDGQSPVVGFDELQREPPVHAVRF